MCIPRECQEISWQTEAVTSCLFLTNQHYHVTPENLIETQTETVLLLVQISKTLVRPEPLDWCNGSGGSGHCSEYRHSEYLPNFDTVIVISPSSSQGISFPSWTLKRSVIRTMIVVAYLAVPVQGKYINIKHQVKEQHFEAPETPVSAPLCSLSKLFA